MPASAVNALQIITAFGAVKHIIILTDNPVAGPGVHHRQGDYNKDNTNNVGGTHISQCIEYRVEKIP